MLFFSFSLSPSLSFLSFLPLSLPPFLHLCSVAVCSVVGDPYPPSQLTGLWLRHQLVAFREKDSALFLCSAIEKQHRTCTLTFHSALSES